MEPANIVISVKKRELIRPRISYWKVSFNIIIPVFLCLIACYWNVWLALTGLCLYTLFRLKGMAIWFIHVYQRYAPDNVRLACVFEPSCSEYMILSIKKYGVICGIIKGIKRLKRCHMPGGIDYP